MRSANDSSMEIGKQFNTLTLIEYKQYIQDHKNYSDFNTLGLYRSILENNNLTPDQKLELREFAHQYFQKTFNFLQLKDPLTYVKVSTLGQELTKADKDQVWSDVIANQQKILNDKKIKHRNFGTYSKHNCGYDDCPYNGLMIKQGSPLEENSIHFQSDKSKYSAKMKSERLRKEQQAWKHTREEEL